VHKTISAIREIARYSTEKRIDVVVAHGHHAWMYAGPAAKLAGVKSVFFAHQIMDPADVTFKHPIEFIGNHISPSLILANSQATKESVERIWRKVCLKPRYGIDLHRFLSLQSLNGNLRSHLDLPKDCFVVTVIGRIQEWKGQEHLLKAAPAILNEVPNTCFLIAGSPTFEKDMSYLNHLKEIVDKSKIENHVRFLGFRKDIPEILAASDVLVHTSIQPEPFGLVILEGMAAGKPVIATDAGGPAEIIRNGQDGFLVPPADSQALADNVIRLLKDSQLAADIGRNARIRSMDFSIEACMRDVESLLEQLISK
jgi:glycosyltransferase involved in cell wall biosynthesis